MEDSDDTPVYYVNDFEDDQSDTHSISTTTSGFTDHSMSTLTSSEASGMLFSFMPSRVYLCSFAFTRVLLGDTWPDVSPGPKRTSPLSH